jgi:N6-adenosine-specific RNA methylase IME4/ParB-like chromosome segregation protein Spo0J
MLKPIRDIKIGSRYRKQMGDIESLARSIEENGLLHPIVIDKKNRLIVGERRIRAFKFLGRDKIPVTVIDLAKIVKGEHAENSERKDFTLSEAVAIKRAIEPLVKSEIKRGRPHKDAKLAPLLKGKARDIVAKRTGKKRTTLAKAEELVKASEAEPDNQFIAKLVKAMDASGRVDAPYKRLKVHRQAKIIRAEPPPLPMNGPYRVIVADPPWPYENRIDDATHDRGVLEYPTMSIADICALDVASIAHKDCILWLWTTNHFIVDYAKQVLTAWGFKPKTVLTWDKGKIGMGEWLRGQTEHCVVAIRGKPTVQLTNESTMLRAAPRAHSQKPEEFYELVEKLCPAPRYAELFSRQERDGWDGHGNDIKKIAKQAAE